MPAADPYANLSPELNAALAQRALQYASPGTVPYIQHSAILADALRNIQQNGGQNLRTGGALASNLLAEALLQFSKRQTDKQLMQRELSDRQAMMAGLLASTPGGSGQPPPDPSTPDSGSPPSSQSPSAAAQPSPTSDPALLAGALKGEGGPPPDWNAVGQSHDMLVRALMGEDRSDAGQQAAASVIMNRAQDAHLSPDQVIAAKGQFEPFDNKTTWNRLSAIPTDNPAYLRAAANADQVLNHGATTPADHFYGPQAQAQLAQVDGRPAVPSWDDGSGVQIGGNRFFQQGYTAPRSVPPMLSTPGFGATPTAMAQGQAGGGALPAAHSAQVTAGLPPSQSTPGTPSPFQVNSSGVAAPAQGSQVASQPQPQPRQWQAPPHNLPMTPEERTQLQAMMSSGIPAIQEQAMQYLLTVVRPRAMGYQDAPKDMQWDGYQGKWVPKPGTQYSTVSSGPAGVTQADPFGHYGSTSNPNAGAVPAGTMASNGQNGPTITAMQGAGLRPMTDAERQQWHISPTDRNSYGIGPDGQPKVAVADQFPPERQMAYTAQVTGLEPYKNYVLGRGYLSAMQKLMTQPGGFSDLSLIENAGKTINPQIAIRPNMIEQYGKEVGFPDWLTGEISKVFNNGGHLTAQGRNALLNIAQANVQSHWEQLQPILAKVDHDAARYGLSRQDLLPDLVPMPGAPPAPYPGASVPGAQQPGGPQPQAAQPAPTPTPQPQPRPQPQAMQVPPTMDLVVPTGAPAGTMRRKSDHRYFVKHADGTWSQWVPDR